MEEPLYETVEVPVVPMRHQIGKYVVGAIATFIVAKVADRAYDNGLTKYRAWQAERSNWKE